MEPTQNYNLSSNASQGNDLVQPAPLSQQGHIISLSTSTKVLYSLFNFFAPVWLTLMLIGIFEWFTWTSLLTFLASIGLGLFCLLYNLRKYNHFLKINGKILQICSGKQTEPEVLETVLVEDTSTYKWCGVFTLICNDKKIKLLHLFPSMVGLICVFGVKTCVAYLYGVFLMQNKKKELYDIFPQLFEKAPKVNSTACIIFSVIMWIMTLSISINVLWGILAAFFPDLVTPGA